LKKAPQTKNIATGYARKKPSYWHTSTHYEPQTKKPVADALLLSQLQCQESPVTGHLLAVSQITQRPHGAATSLKKKLLDKRIFLAIFDVVMD